MIDNCGDTIEGWSKNKLAAHMFRGSNNRRTDRKINRFRERSLKGLGQWTSYLRYRWRRGFFPARSAFHAQRKRNKEKRQRLNGAVWSHNLWNISLCSLSLVMNRCGVICESLYLPKCSRSFRCFISHIQLIYRKKYHNKNIKKSSVMMLSRTVQHSMAAYCNRLRISIALVKAECLEDSFKVLLREIMNRDGSCTEIPCNLDFGAKSLDQFLLQIPK